VDVWGTVYKTISGIVTLSSNEGKWKKFSSKAVSPFDDDDRQPATGLDIRTGAIKLNTSAQRCRQKVVPKSIFGLKSFELKILRLFHNVIISLKSIMGSRLEFVGNVERNKENYLVKKCTRLQVVSFMTDSWPCMILLNVGWNQIRNSLDYD